jgi:hypothetical protein
MTNLPRKRQFAAPRRGRRKILLPRDGGRVVASEYENMPNEIHSYNELQRQIHDDLRAQHPDWVQPDGNCPTCESYELRLAELLGLNRRGLEPAVA